MNAKIVLFVLNRSYLCYYTICMTVSLIKCLTDRPFKICNNWSFFAYPPFLIDKVIKKYLDYNFYNNQNQLKDKSDVLYFELPYIGNL